MEQNVLNHRDMSGMERWENCFPDLPRIIESSETQTATDFDAKKIPNHEDTRTFQCRFYSDSNKEKQRLLRRSIIATKSIHHYRKAMLTLLL